MRTSTIIFFVLITYFGIPILANAANANGSSCTQNSSCTSNYCNSFICEAAPANANPQNRPANTNPSSNITLINPLNTGECAPNENCLLNFLNKILEFVIRIGIVVVVLMTVFVGYKFVAAQGKETEIREARQALLWTVVGALILLGAKVIAEGIRLTVQALSVGQ
ncbi:hypothetical protein HY412_01440 [Candidatus Kaiserbacteria bacterium]|nr:hypothetical protein [Candidatus Kaiserbacteria bacterium]